MGEYKYLYKLQMLSLCFMLASLVLSHKMIDFYGIQFSAASLTFPNTILISNIVSIAYGSVYGINIMWTSLKYQIPFTIICFICISLPSSEFQNATDAYYFVFNELWRVSASSILGAYIGFKANIFVLSRFNIISRFKNLWLKNLASCGIGEIVFTLVAVPLFFIGKIPFFDISRVVLTSIAVKVIYSSILSSFTKLTADFLINNEEKKSERNFSYNPLKAINNKDI